MHVFKIIILFVAKIDMKNMIAEMNKKREAESESIVEEKPKIVVKVITTPSKGPLNIPLPPKMPIPPVPQAISKVQTMTPVQVKPVTIPIINTKPIEQEKKEIKSQGQKDTPLIKETPVLKEAPVIKEAPIVKKVEAVKPQEIISIQQVLSKEESIKIIFIF